MTENDQIKAHMQACGSRFGSVVFVKKDGSIRRLTFQLAAMASRIKGTRPEATATRKANHPNLMPVWDIQKHAFRSVNLDTVLTVKADGKITRYRERVAVVTFFDPLTRP